MRTRMLCLALTSAIAGVTDPLFAATPASGSVNAGSPEIAWTGTNKPASASAECAGTTDPACDYFTLTVVDPGYPFQVDVTLDPSAAGDWDGQIFTTDGTLVDSSGNNPGQPETMEITAPGTYVIAASPFLPNPAIPYSGSARLRALPATVTTSPSTAPAPNFLTYAPPGLTETDPDFQRYAPTRGVPGLGTSAGEPTLGVPANANRAQQASAPNKSNVLYIANLQTLRLEVDSSTSPAIGTWVDKSCAQHVSTLDPILHVDPVSGRVISTQLSAKRSLMCLSADGGNSWQPSPQGAGINSGVDHQTIGSGPFPTGDIVRQPDPLGPGSNYPSATYYASQDIALAQASQSRDGGFSWGMSFPMYNITQCDGLHGHLQVGVDGTVYVPNGNCPLGQSGLARSTDGGVNWTVHGVPNTVSADDPGIGIGRGDKVPHGRMFFGVCQNGTPMATVSDDRGESFAPLINVDNGRTLQACAFPTVVAGDDDRAAFAFLASTTPGAAAYGSDPAAYTGVWHVYVSMTYDGGRTWVTSNASPNDPVQRGPICHAGLGCDGYRNLLDFNDIQLDEKGRVYVAYADGCVDNCVQGGPNSLTAYSRIARQQDGTRGLLAAHDEALAPSVARAPASPYVEAARTSTTLADVKWTRPYSNAAITGYRLFRRTTAGAYGAALASLPAETLGYSDASVAAGTDYCYQVRAANSAGESVSSFEACAVAPVVVGDRCVSPGLQLGDDRSGEPSDLTALGIRRLSAGEPFVGNPLQCNAFAVPRVEFTVNLGQKLLPGNAMLLIWNRQTGAVPSRVLGAQPDDRNMISVRMVGNTPQCRFGHVTGSSTTDPFPSHGYDITAALASEFCIVRDDGSVTVRLATATIDDGVVAPGYSFGALEARTFAFQPVASILAPQPVLRTAAVDFQVATSFSVVGEETCRPNFAPVAGDDRATHNFKSPVDIDVLANDSTGGDCGDSIRIVSASNGAYGSVQIVGNRLRYSPSRSRHCTDEFTYTIADNKGKTDSAVVFIKTTERGCGG